MVRTPEPLVSIVIPSLNRANLLIPTIDSVLQQSYRNIECIVVDGGSTDGTIEILKSYGDQLKWISEPDNSVTEAINKGWAMSRGDILAFQNADDIYAIPDAIGEAVKFLLANPKVDVVYGSIVGIDYDGNVLGDVIKPPEWDLVRAIKNCDHIIFSASAFIRRSILEKVDWMDNNFPFSPDHELWLRIGLVGTLRPTATLFSFTRQHKGISQAQEAGNYKIKITRNFLAQNHLPHPFDSNAFRRRAISNSYLTASLYDWYGRHISKFLSHLIMSVIKDPINLPHILLRTLKYIANTEVSRRTPREFKLLFKKIFRFDK